MSIKQNKIKELNAIIARTPLAIRKNLKVELINGKIEYWRDIELPSGKRLRTQTNFHDFMNFLNPEDVEYIKTKYGHNK